MAAAQLVRAPLHLFSLLTSFSAVVFREGFERAG